MALFMEQKKLFFFSPRTHLTMSIRLDLPNLRLQEKMGEYVQAERTLMNYCGRCAVLVTVLGFARGYAVFTMLQYSCAAQEVTVRGCLAGRGLPAFVVEGRSIYITWRTGSGREALG